MEQDHFKSCPFCGEQIRATAIKCRYCGEWISKRPEIVAAQDEDPSNLELKLPPSGFSAVNWYREAAAQGHAGAQNCLGLCYMDGKAVLQDTSKAVELFRKAADQGFSEAQVNLGLAYAHGKGVQKDWGRAAGQGTKEDKIQVPEQLAADAPKARVARREIRTARRLGQCFGER